MKKIRIHSEILYIIGTFLIALAVALSISSNFGISVLNGPAYVLSIVFGIRITYTEYMIQFLLLILFCIIMKEVKIAFLWCFVTGLIYGGFLRLLQLIPFLSGTMELHLAIRIIFMILSLLIMALAVSLMSRVYLCSTIYDYFIIAIPKKYHLKQSWFKLGYDLSFLVIGVSLSLIILHGLVGFGVGTVIFALLTGPLIGLYNKLFDKILEVKPIFKKISDYFETTNSKIGQSDEEL